MLEKYADEQPIVTALLKKSIKNNKIVQAYLFSCNDIDYILKFAKDFSKEIITQNFESDYENICLKIDKNIYSELKIIETDSIYIKKEQLVELQHDVKNKPVEGNKIVYIIKNCEKLNASSANSILKFLEEPADDIVAILLTDNISSVLPTIKSRCQVINFKNKNEKIYEDSYKILMDILNIDYIEEEISEFKKKLDCILDFIINLESKHLNTFIYIKKVFDIIKTNDDLNKFLSIMIYFYVDILYIKLERNMKYFNDFNDKITIVSNNNELDDITNKIHILEGLRYESTYNTNTKLIIDKLIIEWGEIVNE